MNHVMARLGLALVAGALLGATVAFGARTEDRSAIFDSAYVAVANKCDPILWDTRDAVAPCMVAPFDPRAPA
jgi:hypothetical protein